MLWQTNPKDPEMPTSLQSSLWTWRLPPSIRMFPVNQSGSDLFDVLLKPVPFVQSVLNLPDHDCGMNLHSR